MSDTMMCQMQPEKKSACTSDGGFILLYVVIAVTIFVALASSVISNTVTQVELGAQELEGVRAAMSADTALECINYYANLPTRPFYTHTPSVGALSCGPGMDIVPFKNTTVSTCVVNTSPYNLNIHADTEDATVSSCVGVTVTTRPRTVQVRYAPGNSGIGSIFNFCALHIQANGHDGPCVETSGTVRTRWEDIGGYDATKFPSTITVDLTSNAEAGKRPYEDYGASTYDVPTTKNISLMASSTSILQVERSSIPGFRSVTNPVRFQFGDLGSTLNPPPGTIEVTVKTSPTLDTLADPYVIETQITNTTTGEPIETGFAARESALFPNKFDLRVAVPANMPAGVYLLRVTAWYLRASSSVIIPLEIAPSTRGTI